MAEGCDVRGQIAIPEAFWLTVICLGLLAVLGVSPPGQRLISGHRKAMEVIGWHFSLVLLGFSGFALALPRRPGMPIGRPFVVQPLDPFGRDLGVGVTFIALVCLTALGSWRLFMSSTRWAAATLILLAVVVAWLLLTLSIFASGEVFI
jgi:hypothetical protein